MEENALELVTAAVNLAAAAVAALGSWAQLMSARRQRPERRGEPPRGTDDGHRR